MVANKIAHNLSPKKTKITNTLTMTEQLITMLKACLKMNANFSYSLKDWMFESFTFD